MGDIQSDLLSESTDDLSAWRENINCEWSTETVESLIDSEQKWQNVTSFDITKPDHRKFASNLISSYNNQSDAHQIILARSSADVHNEEKDFVHLLSRMIKPS